MNCTDFLARHSDYVDGIADAADATRLEAHASSCASCARYDRVVRKGAQLVRDVLPRVHASDQFEPRLRHRLLHVRDDMAHARAGAGTVYAAASIVLLIAAAAIGALMHSASPVVDVPAAYAAAATPVASRALAVPVGPAMPAGSYATPAPAVAPIDADASGQDSHIAAVAGWPVYSRVAVAVAFPSPHTTVAVAPADFRFATAGRPPAVPLLVRH